MNTAQRMMLEAINPDEAYGPVGVPVTIAGVNCRVRRENGYWHVYAPHGVQSFREDICNYQDVFVCMSEFFEGTRL